jgi:hypothetical protein
MTIMTYGTVPCIIIAYVDYKIYRSALSDTAECTCGSSLDPD